MLKIECIKGFCLDGGSLPIMQGEVFELSKNSDECEMLFEAMEGASLNPGMEIEFTNEQLENNFKLVVGRQNYFSYIQVSIIKTIKVMKKVVLLGVTYYEVELKGVSYMSFNPQELVVTMAQANLSLN